MTTLDVIIIVDGVYAAGDIARPAHSLGFAVADGSWRGVAVHHALLEIG